MLALLGLPRSLDGAAGPRSYEATELSLVTRPNNTPVEMKAIKPPANILIRVLAVS